MNALRRAFVAVVPPPAVIAAVESLVESVRAPGDGLRWAPPGQWHLTLQFLGGVDESDSVVESLTESLRRVPMFDLQLGGAGAFPKPRHASVLWLGPTAGRAELADLAGVVRRSTAAVGVDPEDRAFRPHLTLARAPKARDLGGLVAALGDGPAGPRWTVEQVALVESDTRPEGPVHTVRARFALGARDPLAG
jgi:2'-5' RNA ligase